MKRMMILLTMLVLLFPLNVKAETLQIEATAYCDNGTTATGEQTYEGGCAFSPKYYGKTIWVFEDKGNGIQVENLIGCYKCNDTGSSRIRNAEVIDIFINDYESCIQFGRKKVFVYVE